MSEVERNFRLLTQEERKVAIDAIIGYFYSERKEEIGIIAAEDVLDFFLQNIGVKIFNNGLEIARTAVEKGFEESNSKISELKR